MKKTLYTLLISLLLGSTSFAQQEQSFKDVTIPLSLKSAIAQGLRKNHDQDLRQFRKIVNELDYEDNKDAFWLPNIKLQLSTSDDRLGKAFADKEDKSYDVPTGMMSLDFGEYSLFNWGKDYLSFLNQRSNYEREKVRLTEESRNLKYQIMTKYLELLTATKILSVRETSLRHASFIFRFNYDKAKLKKISKQEFYQSKSQYLDAQSSFQAAKDTVNQLERDLSYLINDTPDTSYRITEEIKFSRLKGKLDKLVSLAKNHNENIKEVKNDLLISDREYQIEKKENLPLPKLSLKMGAYKYQFDDNDSSSHFENSLGTDGVDLVATINASWTITGPGGLFNNRNKKRALIKKNIAIKQLAQTKHNVENTVRSLFKKVQFLERNQPILETGVQTADRAFDVILDNYTAKRTRFINLKDALDEKANIKVQMLNNKLEHAKSKILIARIAGVDDLPGESLELMATYGDSE